MINKLNLLSVRSAKGTAGQLSRPACAQGIHHSVPNVYPLIRLFTGRIISPLTAVFFNANAGLRMKRPSRPSRPSRLSRLICTVLLTGLFGLVLAGCAGGGGGSGGGNSISSNISVVSNIQTLVGEDHILVGWTNPAEENITGFNIVWFNVANVSDGDMAELNATGADVLQGARVIYNITGLTNQITYNITIAVLYENGDVGLSSSVGSRAGADAGVGTDIDLDGTNNDDDAFPTNACASTDTDNDGDPDSVVAGCQTDLTADPDDDNDGVNDLADDGMSPLDACPRGDTGWTSDTTTDHDNDGCRDDSNEDLDDDNDGVNDLVDLCRRGETSWKSNRMTDNDGDGCRDADEDPDDDNDGTEDTADVDDNNNSLIEIYTLDDLVRLRDDLDGNGVDDGNNGTITAVGSVGCPVPDGCAGYELTRSLNFSDADSYNGSSVNMDDWTDPAGSGWVPIGECSDTNTCNARYTATFDGGGYHIADLFISAADDAIGVGLFASLQDGSIQNLRLLNANVSGGAANVGLLAGFSGSARYENLSVIGGTVTSPLRNRVGGMIGYAESVSASGSHVEIRNSYVSDIVVSGNAQVGGLIGQVGDMAGQVDEATIRTVSVFNVTVTGRGAGVGGLIGQADEATIRAVSVFNVNVNVTVTGAVRGVGGLVGVVDAAMIRAVSVFGGTVTGNNNVGGMIGDRPDGGSIPGGTPNLEPVEIHHSYVSGVDVSGDNQVGGLIGRGDISTINHSYVVGGTVDGSNKIGGLVGAGGPDIRYSYAATPVSGSGNVGGLLGSNETLSTFTPTVIASYWDNEITGQPTSVGGGMGLTTNALQSPTTFTGIYADWDNFWCDPRTGEVREDSTTDGLGAPFVPVWDLGETGQYPVLNCLSVSVEDQQQQQRQ